MKKKAIIVSIRGTNLSNKEKALLSNEKPWGLILFKRNIKSFNQIVNLIKKIRKYAQDDKFPILIDEEGAKVSRMESIIQHDLNATFWKSLLTDQKIAIEFYKTYLNSLCNKLKKSALM